jgi:hypothetical protein
VNVSVLDGKTMIPIGLVCGAIIVAFGIINPIVSAAIDSARDDATIATKIDMTLADHSKRISKVEQRQEYIYNATIRIETRLGTLPDAMTK